MSSDVLVAFDDDDSGVVLMRIQPDGVRVLRHLDTRPGARHRLRLGATPDAVTVCWDDLGAEGDVRVARFGWGGERVDLAPPPHRVPVSFDLYRFHDTGALTVLEAFGPPALHLLAPGATDWVRRPLPEGFAYRDVELDLAGGALLAGAAPGAGPDLVPALLRLSEDGAVAVAAAPDEADPATGATRLRRWWPRWRHEPFGTLTRSGDSTVLHRVGGTWDTTITVITALGQQPARTFCLFDDRVTVWASCPDGRVRCVTWQGMVVAPTADGWWQESAAPVLGDLLRPDRSDQLGVATGEYRGHWLLAVDAQPRRGDALDRRTMAVVRLSDAGQAEVVWRPERRGRVLGLATLG